MLLHGVQKSHTLLYFDLRHWKFTQRFFRTINNFVSELRFLFQCNRFATRFRYIRETNNEKKVLAIFTQNNLLHWEMIGRSVGKKNRKNNKPELLPTSMHEKAVSYCVWCYSFCLYRYFIEERFHWFLNISNKIRSILNFNSF